MTLPRKSNLELLRIVAMFFVLLIHYIPTRLEPGPSSVHDAFWPTVQYLSLNALSIVCVNLFMLITGWFGIHWKLKSISKLLYTIVLWGGCSMFVGWALPHLVPTGRGFASAGFLTEAFTARWFVSCYLMLYLFAPVLNAFLKQVSVRDLGKFLLIYFTVSTLFGWILKSGVFNEGMSVTHMMGLYLTGHWLRRCELRIFSIRARWYLAGYLLLGALLVAVNLVSYHMGFTKSIFGYLNPVCILMSVSLFLCFAKINVPYRRWINLVGASTLPAYLFHHNAWVFGHFTDLGNWLNANVEWPLAAMSAAILGIILMCALTDHLFLRAFDFILAQLIGKSRKSSPVPQN